jgi:hypothetical protein
VNARFQPFQPGDTVTLKGVSIPLVVQSIHLGPMGWTALCRRSPETWAGFDPFGNHAAEWIPADLLEVWPQHDREIIEYMEQRDPRFAIKIIGKALDPVVPASEIAVGDIVRNRDHEHDPSIYRVLSAAQQDGDRFLLIVLLGPDPPIGPIYQSMPEDCLELVPPTETKPPAKAGSWRTRPGLL